MLAFTRATDALGSSWGEPQTLDSFYYLDTGTAASMAIVNGLPAIAYRGGYSGLSYVSAMDSVGSSWGAPLILDSYGDLAVTSSLAEVAGSAAIFYSELKGNDSELNFLRLNP